MSRAGNSRPNPMERQVAAARHRIRLALVRLENGAPGDPYPIEWAIRNLHEAVSFLDRRRK